MAFLQALNGPDRGRRYPLEQPTILVGRHPQCDIIVDVGAVSRKHAQVIVDGDRVYLEDLNSRNGTYVNENLVTNRQLLKENDEIRICDVTLVFTSGDQKQQEHGSVVTQVLLEDTSPSKSSTIMTKLDATGGSEFRLTASAEAKLKAMLEITRALGQALALDDVLPKVLNSLFKIFIQADRGFIVLKDGSGNLIPRWTKLRRSDEDDMIRISRTIVTRVMEMKEAILSADATTDSRFDMSQSIADFRIRSMMCAPLIDSEGKVLGVLQLDTADQKQRFQAEDLEVLVSVASQAAIAIHNAQMHEAALEQKALQRDLELARRVQRGFLPQRRPKLDVFEFFDFYRPANQIGGDYFDYVTLRDGRIATIVADVVGHGVAAALLMAKLSTEARFHLATTDDPAQAVFRLNNALCEDSEGDRFVTFVMSVLDPTSNDIVVVNAGHPLPLLRSNEGYLGWIGGERTGLPLGIAEDFEFEPETFTLQCGDQLAMFTDGISEAMNDVGDQYSNQRIEAALRTSQERFEMWAESLLSDVDRFMGNTSQYDDMCLVCVRRR
ncbi:MAG: SpoIIE family protein phosphatase [Pirellulaceae bacterium]|nr:SpoIIE family protein phosphatase [Planctomycetales bacterium]